jgi:hypothetical protein
MTLRHIYLGLCVLGAVLPYWQFVPWLASHGFDLSLFVSELLSTRIGAFFGMDVIVSAFVLFVFVVVEGRRLAIRTLWLPVVATWPSVYRSDFLYSCICGNSSWKRKQRHRRK